MDEFYKSLTLDLKFDESNVRSIKSSLDALTENKLFGKDEADRLNKQLSDYAKKEATILKLQRDIENLRKLNTKESAEAIRKLQKELNDLQGTDDKASKFDIKTMLLGFVANMTRKLKGVFDDALSELRTMQSYSRLTNASTRELRLGYGFSAGQAYGFSKASGLLGIESMEDLMWADSQQLQLFRDAFDKYTAYYEDTMTPEFLQAQLQFQVDMDKLKLDLQHTVIDFFLNNEDEIIEFLEFNIEVGKFIIDTLSWIVNAFSDKGRSESARSRETASILNSYTNSTRNTNMSVNNTFNGVSKDDQTWLANAGQQMYKQAIETLKRG